MINTVTAMDLNTTQAAHDDLDDLFNYDVGGEDPLHPPEQTMDAEAPLEPRRPKPIDLGIDEEVIQRKRKPNPKLDEGRYLSIFVVAAVLYLCNQVVVAKRYSQITTYYKRPAKI